MVGHLQVHQLMQRGAAQRTTGVTKLNKTSSRSHAVFTVITEKSAMAGDAEVEQFCGLGTGECIPPAMCNGVLRSSPSWAPRFLKGYGGAQACPLHRPWHQQAMQPALSGPASSTWWTWLVRSGCTSQEQQVSSK